MLPGHSGSLPVELAADPSMCEGEGECKHHIFAPIIQNRGKRKLQHGQPGNAGPGITVGVKKQVQKRTSTERAKSVLLAHSVYLHRDERIKEEKQEPTKLLRKNTFKDCGSECLTQKMPAAAQQDGVARKQKPLG